MRACRLARVARWCARRAAPRTRARTTPGRALTEFFQKRDEFYYDLNNQGMLQAYSAWRLLLSKKELAKNNQFVLAVIQNVLLLIRFSYLKDVLLSFNEESHGPMHVLGPLIIKFLDDGNVLLGLMQCLSCVVVFILYGFHNFPTVLYRKWTEDTGKSPSDAFQLARGGDPYWAIQVAWRTPLYFLSDNQFAAYTIFFVAAILGLSYSPFWFCIHLLDVLNKSEELQFVIKAVTNNFRSILMTAVLGLFIIYIYAVIAFKLFKDDLILDNYPDDDVAMCDDLFMCFLNAMSEGLRAGDIGAIIDPTPPGEEMYGAKLAYEMTYYIFVITIILNVVFGIIIDTFAQLREEAKFRQDQINGLCFVCNLERFTFDTKGNGFEDHVKKDHNMWQYMFLMIYLKDKDHTDYNGWEQYVWSKMQKDDTSFFPIAKAIVLMSLKEQEEAEEQAREERMLVLSEDARSIATTVDSLAKHIYGHIGENDPKHASLEMKVDRIMMAIEAMAPPVVEAQMVSVRQP